MREKKRCEFLTQVLVTKGKIAEQTTMSSDGKGVPAFTCTGRESALSTSLLILRCVSCISPERHKDQSKEKSDSVACTSEKNAKKKEAFVTIHRFVRAKFERERRKCQRTAPEAKFELMFINPIHILT